MVRCEEFYKYFEKRGNFCRKSDMVVKKVEEYIDYVKRNKIGGFRISNCALDPFINIEDVKDGKVHDIALRELKGVLKRGKIAPEKVTRRITIEIINRANNQVGDQHKLDHIPNIRKRMDQYEHDIGNVEYDVRNTFDEIKNNIGLKNNNQAMKVILELCVRNMENMRKIKDEIENKEMDNVEMIKTV